LDGWNALLGKAAIPDRANPHFFSKAPVFPGVAWSPAHATPPAAPVHWRSAGKSFHWRAIYAMPIATFLDPK